MMFRWKPVWVASVSQTVDDLCLKPELIFVTLYKRFTCYFRRCSYLVFTNIISF